MQKTICKKKKKFIKRQNKSKLENKNRTNQFDSNLDEKKNHQTVSSMLTMNGKSGDMAVS
jgi:hypothetical protein